MKKLKTKIKYGAVDTKTALKYIKPDFNKAPKGLKGLKGSKQKLQKEANEID